MTNPTVVDRTHAKVSPSSFERAEACTSSVHLSASIEPTDSGPDALVGTAAHAVLEHCLREDLHTFEVMASGLQSIEVEGQAIAVDQEMLDAVQVALDFVRADPLFYGRSILVEQTLHLAFAEQYLGEPMWGHADVLAPELPVIVLDYKHGFNAVAGDSVQLGLYVLAAVLDKTGGRLDGHEGLAGTAVVVQPRSEGDTVKGHAWTYQALRDLRNRVIDVLRRIKRQDWTYGYGPHCRWCPAAAMCPQLAAVARDYALAKVAPTPEMVATGEVTAQTLDEWYRTIQVLDHWSKAVVNTVHDYLLHGGQLENAKLVRHAANRRWRAATDGEAAEQLLTLGVDPWQRKIVTPAEAERRLPEAKHKLLRPLWEKPEGRLSVAPMSDPKPAVDVGATLKASLQSSVAAGYLSSAKGKRLTSKGE